MLARKALYHLSHSTAPRVRGLKVSYSIIVLEVE
jgi:hypothetical protein